MERKVLALFALVVLGSSLAPAALASGSRALDGDDDKAGDEIAFDTIAVDDFSSYPNETYISAADVRGGYILENLSPEEYALEPMADASGGAALVISDLGGNSTNEWKRIVSKAFFPYGPDATYEVEVRMKRSPDFAGQVFAGASGFVPGAAAADSQDYFALNEETGLSTEWQEFSTVTSGGATGGSLVPLLLINFGDEAAGKVYLDSLTVRKAAPSEAFRLKDSETSPAGAAADVLLLTSGAKTNTFMGSLVGAALLSLACL